MIIFGSNSSNLNNLVSVLVGVLMRDKEIDRIIWLGFYVDEVSNFEIQICVRGNLVSVHVDGKLLIKMDHYH